MPYFVVDSASGDSCRTCCCEQMSLKPGTTSRVAVNYAPWVIPIGRLHCVPQFQLDLQNSCPSVSGGNRPPGPTVTPIAFSTPINTLLTGDLATVVTDADGDPITFKPLLLYDALHGKLDLDSDGSFTYTPDPGFTGVDKFFFSASDEYNPPVVLEAGVGVGVPIGSVKGTPRVAVGSPSVDQKLCTVDFPLSVSPAAPPCEVWRLTVLQGALSCENQCYTRTDCYDVHVAKC